MKGLSGSQDKKAVLVVSFGTSYQDNIEKTIAAIEKAIAAQFLDFNIRRAFTSQMVIDLLAERDGIIIDNVTQALEKLAGEGYGFIIIQPTHVINGIEYDEMRKAVRPFEATFNKIVYGAPLLTDDLDYDQVVRIVAEETREYNAAETAIVCMGHGTEHQANSVYTKLDDCFKKAGYRNYFVGTVEAAPTIEDIRASVARCGANKVVLLPLMIVAGDHANHDMAGEEESSWNMQLKGDGYEVTCLLRGLGEYRAVQEMFVKHALKAAGVLSER